LRQVTTKILNMDGTRTCGCLTVGHPFETLSLRGCSLRTLPSACGSWQFSLWRTRLGVVLPSTGISDQFASVSRSVSTVQLSVSIEYQALHHQWRENYGRLFGYQFIFIRPLVSDTTSGYFHGTVIEIVEK